MLNISFSSGTIFGGNSDGIDLKMRNIFNSNKDENSDMKKVLERLDDQTDKLEKLEMAINEKGYKIPVQPEKQETSKGATLENVPESPKKGVSFRLSNPPVEVSANKDLFWIEDIKKEFQTDGLGDGEERKLRNKELMFWDDLIAKYLKPLTQTKEDKADASNGLKELRNNTTFSFLIVNCIVILVVFLLQNRTDILGVQWPIPKEVCKYYKSLKFFKFLVISCPLYRTQKSHGMRKKKRFTYFFTTIKLNQLASC